MDKKTALVTGACINTGVAIVERLAREGYNVFFTGRSEASVREKEREYRERFPDVEIVGYVLNSLLDEITVDERAVEEMFSDIDSRGVFVETLVLNAADQGLSQKIFENPLTDFMKVINTNVVWNYCICEYAAKRMKENGGGNIIFINSNTAYRAIPDRIAYVASKGGQLGLMRALALDLGKYNIRVNAVLPGMTATEAVEKNLTEEFRNLFLRHIPLGRIGLPEEISEAVCYFASDASAYTTGQILTVSGGFGLATPVYGDLANKDNRR